MYFKKNHHAAIIERSDWEKVQEILSVRHRVEKAGSIRRLANCFIAPRVKDGILKGYYIIDFRWTAAERRDFMKIINEAFC